MKIKSIVILVLATMSLITAPATQASDCGYRARNATIDFCTPRHVCTKELCRRTECRWAKDHCGRRVSFEVVVITFADFYSDGSSRTYTRTQSV